MVLLPQVLGVCVRLDEKLPVSVTERVWLGLPEKDGVAVVDELCESDMVEQPLADKDDEMVSLPHGLGVRDTLVVKLLVSVEERVWLGLPENDDVALGDELCESEIVEQPLADNDEEVVPLPHWLGVCDTLVVKLPDSVVERVWLGLPVKEGEAVEDELRESEMVTQPLAEKDGV